jgi:hypothetical protein
MVFKYVREVPSVGKLLIFLSKLYGNNYAYRVDRENLTLGVKKWVMQARTRNNLSKFGVTIILDGPENIHVDQCSLGKAEPEEDFEAESCE